MRKSLILLLCYCKCTKGKLICDDEYLELIKKCNCVVQVSMVCSKYDVLEKGAPTYNERLQMLKKLVKNCKRVVVRIQPYMTEVYEDVIESLEKYAEIGVYGITIEGMKFTRQQKGLVKLAGDFVYPKKTLEKHFEAIREKCHELGLVFLCAENRLRTMGDSMTCCGCDGLAGFKPNTYNLEHIYNGENVKPTNAMKQAGSAACFKAIMQSAGSGRLLKKNSLETMMMSRNMFDAYEPVVLGGLERENDKKQRLEFTTWLRSTGVNAKDIKDYTGTQMGSHWLCVKIDGQTEIPTRDNLTNSGDARK